MKAIKETENITEVLVKEMEYYGKNVTKNITYVELVFADYEGNNTNIKIDTYDQLIRYGLDGYFSEAELKKLAIKITEKSLKEFTDRIEKFKEKYGETNKRFKFNIAQIVKNNARRVVSDYLFRHKRVVL